MPGGYATIRTPLPFRMPHIHPSIAASLSRAITFGLRALNSACRNAAAHIHRALPRYQAMVCDIHYRDTAPTISGQDDISNGGTWTRAVLDMDTAVADAGHYRDGRGTTVPGLLGPSR